MKSSVLALSLAAVIGVSSCSDKCGKTMSLDSDIAFTTITRSATYSLVGSANDFGSDKDIQFYDSVSIVMPVRISGVDITTLCDSIAAYAFDAAPGTPIMGAAAEWMSNRPGESGYKVKLATTIDDTSFGEAYVNGFVYTLTPSLLVYCVRSESLEPGAAHGMNSTRYINFVYDEASSVKGIITLKDLFTKDGLKELPSIIGDRASDLFSAIGPTGVDALPENDNFYINAMGEIVFSYQPYEIASYAQGNIEISFAPYELVDLFTDKGISFFGLEDLND